MSLARNKIYTTDVLSGLKRLDDNSIDCVLTSPPYWAKRDYGIPGTRWADGTTCPLGLEHSVAEFIDHLCQIFDEIRRVLKPTGTCWVVLGDGYVGSWGNYAPNGIVGKQRNRSEHGRRWDRPGYEDNTSRPPSSRPQPIPRKSLCLVPEQFAIEMINRGWTLRNKVIWHKPNHMPESVRDRFACSWESVLLFAKSPRYFFNLNAVRIPHKTLNPSIPWHAVPLRKRIPRLHPGPNGKLLPPSKGERNAYHPHGKNPGDCWIIPTKPFPEAHFAVYPEALCERPILAGCPEKVCAKCGTPQLEIETGGSPDAFNIRVRDVKKGRLRHLDRRASSAEVRNYDENRYVSTRKRKKVLGCSCKARLKPGLVLDPFSGAGTTAVVANRYGRDFIGFERKPEYARMARHRIRQDNRRTAA